MTGSHPVVAVDPEPTPGEVLPFHRKPPPEP